MFGGGLLVPGSLPGPPVIKQLMQIVVWCLARVGGFSQCASPNNSLSIASFAIIFSQCEGCLFTLLIVSFIVQKLLSLIRSHLFIVAFISITLGGGS